MVQQLIEKKNKLAVIGVGYVGLPVALFFAKKIKVIGYDTNPQTIALLKNRTDPYGELDSSAFDDCDILFSNDPSALRAAQFYIVTVPTPVDAENIPDLGPLLSASQTVGGVLKKGDYVVYESTTYPGCTEDDCIPVLERTSGLRNGIDFKTGYSPERINPGDKMHSFTNVQKVVSGSDEESLDEIAAVYELVVEAGVYKAPSIKVAEAAKIIENTQRDLNIALMNELSMMFDRMNINTFDVLKASATKWNFLPFNPGLVGGHCTGVDPYYLSHKSAALGYESLLIPASRMINDGMARYVAEKIWMHVKQLSDRPKILVKGLTFKENVADIRNSKIVDTVKELIRHAVEVHIEDPCARKEDVKRQYGIELRSEEDKDYDAVVITVPHKAYEKLDDAYFCSITHKDALIADLKAIYKNKIINRKYWTL